MNLLHLGNTVDFGDLLNSQNNMVEWSTPTRTRGWCKWPGATNTGTLIHIQYVTIQLKVHAVDFGDLTAYSMILGVQSHLTHMVGCKNRSPVLY